jgi:putative membrane protein
MNHSHHSSHVLMMLPTLIIGSLLILYFAAVIKEYRKGHLWDIKRVIAMFTGCLLLGAALRPSIHLMAEQDIRWHMVQHLLIGMLAPIALVLGAPMTLLLRTLPKGISRKFLRFLHLKPIKFLSHPVGAFIINIGGMFALYLTPLYFISTQSTLVHWLVHIHFLLAGYLFAWSLIGLDPVPNKVSFNIKLLVIFISMSAHATLSKYMYAQGYPIGTHHPIEQVQAAAKLMYYGGDLSEVVLLIILFLMNKNVFKSRSSHFENLNTAYPQL